MMLEVDVCKVEYARDGVLGLIMMFGIYKMRVSGQKTSWLIDKLIGFDNGDDARILNNTR